MTENEYISADFPNKYSNTNLYVCVCVCMGLVHKNRFNCPSCFKSYRTMLDLAQHRCSAAAKNQVGVSVSEHVCECGV